eukprot:11184449-Lingulodinium_polyedra.AAC.1
MQTSTIKLPVSRPVLAVKERRAAGRPEANRRAQATEVSSVVAVWPGRRGERGPTGISSFVFLRRGLALAGG